MIKQKDYKISKEKMIAKNVCAAHNPRGEGQGTSSRQEWIVVFYLLAIILEMVCF